MPIYVEVNAIAVCKLCAKEARYKRRVPINISYGSPAGSSYGLVTQLEHGYLDPPSDWFFVSAFPDSCLCPDCKNKPSASTP